MRFPASACLAGMLVASASPAFASFERVWSTSEAAVASDRSLAQLTPQEVRELIELDRQIRAQRADKRTPRQKCIDEEIEDLGQEPSHLALRVIDLKCSQR